MAASRNTGVRVTALALACAANAALFLMLWFSRVPEATEQAVVAMIWITDPLPRAALPVPPPDQQQPRPAAVVVRALPRVVAPAPAPSTAITLPPIDWYAEGARSARKVFPDDAREKPRASLDSKPRAMVLPDASTSAPKAGDSVHFEGGETITWINERCFISNRPTESMFGGPPQLKRPTCKVRSMKERASEKRAAELQKEVMPKYLSRPLPEPPPPRP